MLGRYEISSDTRPNPMPASTNDTVVRATPNGRSNPSVSSEEPEMMSASDHGLTPIPQNRPMNPTSTSVTHIAGSASNAIGEYIASTRSRNSNDWRWSAMRSNTRRTLTNVARVSTDEVARGSTTVFTAEPIVHA